MEIDHSGDGRWWGAGGRLSGGNDSPPAKELWKGLLRSKRIRVHLTRPHMPNMTWGWDLLDAIFNYYDAFWLWCMWNENDTNVQIEKRLKGKAERKQDKGGKKRLKYFITGKLFKDELWQCDLILLSLRCVNEHEWRRGYWVQYLLFQVSNCTISKVVLRLCNMDPNRRVCVTRGRTISVYNSPQLGPTDTDTTITILMERERHWLIWSGCITYCQYLQQLVWDEATKSLKLFTA